MRWCPAATDEPFDSIEDWLSTSEGRAEGLEEEVKSYLGDGAVMHIRQWHE